MTEPARDEFHALLEAAVDGIVVIDDRGIVAAFSRAAEEMFGYRADEVIGHNVSMLMPEPYHHEHDGYLERYQRTGEARIIGIGREVSARRKDGSVFPIYLAVGEIRGERPRFVGIIRDITERTRQRQAEIEVRQHRERLAHVGRISLMGEMAAGLAHELNQPLGAITNYAQAARRMLESGQGTDEVDEALGRISMQALRAGDVIRRLRAMIRKRDSEPSIVDVNGIVQDTLGLVEADARANAVRLRVELIPDPPPVRCDVVQIQQVLLNLVRNAIDAMRDDEGQRRTIVIRTDAGDDGMVGIEVADTGPGLEPEHEFRLFTPFHTTKPDGLGLGLSISRSLVESHGGELQYRPNAPRGAVFRFTLPAAKGDADG